MESGGRARPDHLTHFAKLTDRPADYHIFLALRIIEAEFSDAPRFGRSRRPRMDRMRLGQVPELAFPPATLTSVTAPQGNRPGRLRNQFFGLFGPNGPLPLHLTEYARDRLRNRRDPTFVAFADMLTHRLMGLFYRAWSSGQPAPSFDRPDDDVVGGLVAAFSGHRTKGLQDRDAMPDVAKRYFAAHLAAGPKSAEGLKAVLSAFFEAPVRIQEFVGSWLTLEQNDRWQLGAPVGLGRSTSIGGRVWSRNAKFRIRIGPLTWDQYTRLLPGGGSLGRIAAVVRNYVGDTLDYDVNLVLRAADVPQPILGRTVALGHAGWIGSRPADRDADDLFLTPSRRGH